MRNTLVDYLIKTDHKNRYFLTADVGYHCLERLRDKMRDRFINVGIAEPSMISVAAGLALSKKEVFTYTMCSFYLRCIEQIKLDLCYQELPVTMIGVGKGYEYEQHGTTHFALEDVNIIKELRNIEVFDIYTKEGLVDILNKKSNAPRYLRISRFGPVPLNTNVIQDYRYVNTSKYPKEGGSLDYFLNKYENKEHKTTKQQS